MKTAAVVVIDASVWVSRLIPSDVNYNASHLWMEQYKIAKGLLVAPLLLLTEVTAAIARNTGSADLAKEAVKNLTGFSTIRLVSLDAQLIQASIDIAAELQLRAADAFYVAVAHQMNVPLISWDKEQLSRASSLVNTYTPNNYLS